MGISYGASERNPESAPGWILAEKRYGSQRYDTASLQIVLNVAFAMFGIMSGIHLALEFWSHCQWAKWLRQPRTWLTFMTFIWPVVVSITRAEMTVYDWTSLVAVSHVIMLARLIFEGEVIPSCRVLLRTMRVAIGQLTALSLLLAIIFAVLAGVQGVMFGVFLYGSYGESMLSLLYQFGSGAEINPDADLYNPMGAKLMFILVLFVLVLTLSQVFITVLMDAFEAANEELKSIEEELVVGEGFEVMPPRPVAWRDSFSRTVIDRAAFILMYYEPSGGACCHQVMRALSKSITEAEALDPSCEGGCILLTLPALRRAGLPQAAGESLLARFGARKLARHADEPIKDERVELQARAYMLSLSVTLPVPYSDLQAMSIDMLRELVSLLEKHKRPEAGSSFEVHEVHEVPGTSQTVLGCPTNSPFLLRS